MKFSYLVQAFFIASVSMPQIISANVLTIDEVNKITSSDTAAKIAISVVMPAENSKAMHDFGLLISTQTHAEIQQKLSAVSGGLSGGSSGPRALNVHSFNIE